MTDPRRSDIARQSPACPTCGGATWDNRETKRNPRAPDFKCRDRNCAGVIWRYKGAEHHPSIGAAPAHSPRGGRPEAIGPVVARVLGSIGSESPSASPQSGAPVTMPAPARELRSSGAPPQSPSDPADRARTRALYRTSVRYVGRRIVPLCAAFGVSVPADVFAAMVATVFIALHGEDSRALAPARRGRADV